MFKPLYSAFGVLTTAALVALLGFTAAEGASARPAPHRPNIVFVLTDDLEWNLVQFMPHVEELQAQGTTFTNYFVTDSLCCPSRASIFTGRYPHDTRHLHERRRRTADSRSSARATTSATRSRPRLQRRGYLTALMGKYLNGYTPSGRVDRQGRATSRPAGASGTWPATAIRSSTTTSTRTARSPLRLDPEAYLTDVLAAQRQRVHRPRGRGQAVLPRGRHVRAARALHAGAARRGRLPGLQAPRTPAFDEADVSDKPSWLRATRRSRRRRSARSTPGFAGARSRWRRSTT